MLRAIRWTALSLLAFASLALVLPLSAAAQTVRPPVVMFPGDEGSSVPVHVSALDVDTRIVGFLAETTIIMRFDNPNDRRLEGELIFPLPDGATISGYGLDVGGELVDGVVVERQRARVAFETETRQRVDPGLAEWVQGSTFRTRIFPFEPNGSRTIKLSYVSDLADGTTYDLPLAYHDELERLKVRVAVVRGTAQPAVQSGSLSNFEFGQWESQWVAETELTDIRPSEDLRIAVPVQGGAAVVERYDGQVFFAVQDAIEGTTGSATRSRPDRVALVLDVSGSREAADLERERQLVRAWLDDHSDVHVDLIGLSDRLRLIGSFPAADGRAFELTQVMAEEGRDGGTDLGLITFPRELSRLAPGLPERNVDYYLFVGDGLGSLGAPAVIEPEVPVMAVSSSSGANHAWLRHLAAVSGGAFVDLQRVGTDDEALREALAAFTNVPLRIETVEVFSGEVAGIEIDDVSPTDGRVVVSGRLVSAEATIDVHWTQGSDRLRTTRFTVGGDDVAEGDVVSRFWAQQALGRLALQPSEHRLALLELGQRFNLVTPHTSYIVLETLDQHVTHRIAPAASRGDLLDQYNTRIAAIQETKDEEETAKVERVLSDWRGRVSWWQREHEAPPTPSTTTPDPISDENGIMGFGSDSFDGSGTESNADDDERRDRTTTRNRGERDEVVDMPAPASTAQGGVLGDFDGEMAMEEVASGQSAGPSNDGTGSGESDGGQGDSNQAQVSVQGWDPSTPYLAALRGVSPDDAYGVYLDQKHAYGRSPAFYLDVASYLYRIDKDDEARRVLTNISELELGDARLLRIVAYKLQDEGELNLAIRLFEEVRELRPEEPQSHRDLALALSARADLDASADVLRDGAQPMTDWHRAVELLDQVVRMPTPRFYAIEMPSIMEANRILARMATWAEAHGDDVPTVSLDPRLRENLDVDIRVILRWDTDNTDMDLWVTEPSGEKVYYGNRSSGYGGLYGRDYTDGYGPEEYLLRGAVDGDYLVQTNYYGSRQQRLTGGTTLQVDIFTNWGRADEERHSTTIRLTSTGETVDIGNLIMGDGAGRLTRAQ